MYFFIIRDYFFLILESVQNSNNNQFKLNNNNILFFNFKKIYNNNNKLIFNLYNEEEGEIINNNKSDTNTKKENIHKIEYKCTCKKTKCLKNYCECFAHGCFCKLCECANCENRENNSDKIKTFRQIQYIKTQNKSSSTTYSSNSGCSCTKNFCNKKYCECYKNNNPCGYYCKCLNCKNKERNESLIQISKKLNEVNYLNHKRKMKATKIVKPKFLVNKNIVNMLRNINEKKEN